MIQKPRNYDEIDTTITQPKKLTDGGYEGVIKNAEVKHVDSKNGGSFDILCLELDIASGDFKDYYQNRYDKNTNPNKKWPLTRDLFLESSSNTEEANQRNARRLKELITSVEQSNPRFTFNWDEKQLIGKKVGMVFGLEEFNATNLNRVLTAPELRFFRSVNTINEIDYTLPENRLDVKLLDGSYVKYANYVPHGARTTEQDEGDFITIESDDEIPF